LLKPTCQQVWEKIKVGWTKLKDFVGFIFNWDDVVETKNTISAVITATIGAVDGWVEEGQEKINGFFETVEKAIRTPGILDELLSMSTPDAADAQQPRCMTSATWALERMKNGGPTPTMSHNASMYLFFHTVKHKKEKSTEAHTDHH
jgi:hypothetical protein